MQIVFMDNTEKGRARGDIIEAWHTTNFCIVSEVHKHLMQNFLGVPAQKGI